MAPDDARARRAAEALVRAMRSAGCRLFTGVPDSTLRAFVAAVGRDGALHHVAVNEGAAVALAAGWYLATATPAVVYLQNSGLGNALNPLLSLVHRDVYAVPLVLVVGWRGADGNDEPQHLPQGAVTPELLARSGVLTVELDADPTAWPTQAARAVSAAADRSAPVALLVRPGLLDHTERAVHAAQPAHALESSDAVAAVIDAAGRDAIVVGSVGKTSRELLAIKRRIGDDASDFLTVGAMGHAPSIALGIAMARPDLLVVCLDGDGSALMHLGALAAIAATSPARFVHVVLNNGAHDSVDWPNTAAPDTSFSSVAAAVGYPRTARAGTLEDLAAAVRSAAAGLGPTLVEVRTTRTAGLPLPRPNDLAGRKRAFMRRLRDCTQQGPR